MRRIGLMSAAIALTLAATDCDRSSEPSPELELPGVTWTLTSLPGHDPLPPGSFLNATFQNGTIRGSDGCNSYGGPYSATSSGGFAIKELGGTAIGCARPVNDLATAYTKALWRASSYKVDGGSLTLNDSHGAPVIIYGANVPPPITGLRWEAFGFRNGPVDDKQAVVSPIASSAITAAFEANGTMTGSSGCSAYTARFTITGRQIEFGSLVSTRVSCSKKLMGQERAYLSALGSATTWHFSGPSFQLLNETGTVEVAFAPA
jgi:heat shock protein HslJ